LPQNFEELYKTLKNNHPSIVALDDYKIKKIEEDIRVHISERLPPYFLFNLYSIVLSVTIFLLVYINYFYMDQTVSQLSDFLSRKQFIDIPDLRLPFIFIYFSLLFNTFLSFKNEDYKSLAFNIMLDYIFFLIPLHYFYSFELLPKSILNYITTTWLVFVLILGVFIPIFLIMAYMLIFKLGKLKPERTPANIISSLAILIHELDEMDEFTLSNNDFKRGIVRSIINISNMMRLMYRKNAINDPISQWSSKKMESVADNFKSLATWIYFPQQNTLKNLNAQLCMYLNIYLSGHYYELLREDKSHFDGIVFKQIKKSILQEMGIFIYLAVFMALPIIIMLIFITLFKVDIQPVTQSLLTILYIYWGILGLISISDKLSPENKAFLMDFTKLVIKK